MKIKITLAAVILANAIINAQEFNIKISGGPSGIFYDSDSGNGKLNIGAGIGIGYTFFLSENWGISTGIDAVYNQNSFELNDGTIISNYEVDDQTSAFEYRVTASKYKESQSFISASIPLLVQYRTAVSTRSQWYVAAGAKVLFPGKQNIKASAEQLQLSGYYPDLNLLVDDLPVHGFGTTNNWQDKTSVSLQTSFLLSLEMGMSFTLKEKTKLYTGIYLDYGLSDLVKNTPDQNIVSYNPNQIDDIQAQGIVGNKKIVQESRYLAAGIQVKLGFSLHKDKQKPVQIVKDEPKIKNAEPVQEYAPVQQTAQNTEVKNEITVAERNVIEKPLPFEKVGSTGVTAELASRLDEIAIILKRDKNTELNITGYTCDIGSESRNLEIGMKRAQAVEEYLKNKGIEPHRMHLFSKGESDPLVPNVPTTNRPLNRRVTLLLVD
ncbi:OmpA family protein [Flavobacterium sp. ANB]|uniref:OmpA family protein n=1 Tax=unclassified Flavobacterium TaxID=196869 RepID=UPI0012B934A6|nr:MULTISPECIES: OmpA family protein [unclassified Flavobacterium]MBF4516125.1 OmpA family protein [Flavobacterium sp. ANB]MTD72222.1 OmpA family protein [Flavobacterium sp. LC2016-13]